MTATATSPAGQLLRFLARDPELPVLVSPLFSETLPRRLLGAAWQLDQLHPDMVEAKLRLGAEAGFPPVIKVEVGSLGYLVPRERVLRRDGDREEVEQRYETEPPLIGTMIRAPNGVHSTRRMIQSIDDTLRLVWAWEHLGDEATFRQRLRALVRQVGDRGLVCFNIAHPFGSHDDQVTTIYYAMEHPAEMREAADRMCAVKERLLDLALAEGVRLFFAGSLGANLYSPAMVDEWMVPYCVRLREYLHARGGYYYLHECGSMKHKLARGVYEIIRPDWLEGFEAPPLGDVADLAVPRRQLPAEIACKGNLNLEFLQQATPAEVEAQTLALLARVAGYRHVVGGACSLLADTPMANLQALTRATARYLGQG